MYYDTPHMMIPDRGSRYDFGTRRLMQASCRFLICCAVFALLVAAERSTFAAAGDRDPTFGTGGIVTTDFMGGNDNLSKIAVQADGKIVAVGDSYPGGRFALSRYNADGTLDTSFGNGGKGVTVIANVRESANDVMVLRDGRILVCGSIDLPSSSNTSFALLRYKSDGTLDTSFGRNGIVTTDVGIDDDQAYAIAVQSDGKIVVAGRRGIQFYPADQRKGNVALARYSADGVLDTTFGSGGIIVNDFGQGLESYAVALMIQTDGRIVIGGASSYEFLAARYSSDGQLDTTFGGTGYRLANFSSNWDAAEDALLQPDGKIVLVGWATTNSPNYYSLAIARYNPDGTFDPTFGSGGKVLLPTYGGLDAVALQRDGKIVGLASTDTAMILLRLNRNGTPDNTFGSGGYINTSFGTAASEGSDIALQSDGKILAAGIASTDVYFQHTDFGLARYLNPQKPKIDPATAGD